eukprot:GILI01018866.1.p1 GENE.GILI01018866.1~~GILI01018866.1.p1  ORF type:complete len:315 (+),score=43.64 GILI01018866.1:56-1000(+)
MTFVMDSAPTLTMTTTENATADLPNLIQLQYSRAKTFAAWSNLFRMMLLADINAEDFDGLVSSIILPQIQAINNVFRGASAAAAVNNDNSNGSHLNVSQWATHIQNLERERYALIVKYQQLVIDHLASKHVPPSEAKEAEGHTHHCCGHSHDVLAHSTACLFFVGNGHSATDSSSTSPHNNREQVVSSQRALIANLMPTGASSGAVPAHLSFGSQKTIPTSFNLASLYTAGMQWSAPVQSIDSKKGAARIGVETDSDAEETDTQITHDAEFLFRRTVTDGCSAFRANVAACAANIAKIELTLQEAVDEGLEELS